MLNNLINRTLRKIKQGRDFGLWFTLRNIYYRQRNDYDSEIKMIKTKLMMENDSIIDNLRNKIKYWDYTNSAKSRNIYAMWWQGKDNMLETIQICKKSQEKYARRIGAKYHFITKYNLYDYVNIPDKFISMLENGIISITHFSDLVRMTLLESLGGCWIDSTVYVTNECNEDIFLYPFYSFKTDNTVHVPVGIGQKITECKWSSFFIVSPYINSPLITYIKESLYNYWNLHTSVANYFFLNMIIKIAYDEVIEVRNAIDGIPYNNNHIYSLAEIINEPYDSSIMNTIMKDTGFFKLSWKRDFKYFKGNKLSYYGYLCRNNQIKI